MELCGSFLFLMIGIFIIGYLGIIFEFYIKVNKTAVGITLAALCWMVYFLGCSSTLERSIHELGEHLGEVSQIIFFLLGAMTLVELIDSHKGFNTVISWVRTQNKRKLIILISVISFFLSAVLDNLTTTILMISILRKLIPNNKDRLLPGCMIVIAANAGGAWTPIGDVTTTMLWIDNRISTTAVMKDIFLPSLFAMLIPLGFYVSRLKGNYPKPEVDYSEEKREPGSKLVFALGILSLMAVPLVKWLTGLPPFMGILLALAILWIVTDILHYKYEDRGHLRIPFILTKIDVASVLFFFGILLAINALEAVGILKLLATFLNDTVHNSTAIATIIGVISAVIDNVPLVAATMGMYDRIAFPIDSSFWLLTAFTAGTGGSMLSIGSAAGVALMGIEKVDFITYLKKASFPAALGYAGGIIIYILLF
jgi:Na+/H+ antiporter NhaD/arsenite permease-like protein